MKYKDDFSETFHDEHSFLGFLDRIEENAAWQSYQTNSLRIMAIEEELDAKWLIKADRLWNTVPEFRGMHCLTWCSRYLPE